MPALVNTHMHLGPGRGTANYFNMEAARQQYIQDLHTLAYSGVAVSTSMGWDLGPALQLRSEYYPNAARLLTSERGAGVPLGQKPNLQAAHAAGKDTRMDEDMSDSTTWLWTKTQAQIYVQEQAYKRVDFIKMWLDDRLGTELHLSPEIYKPLIEMAHQHDIPVYAHIFFQQDAKDLALSNVDMLAHPVRDSLIDDEFVQIMKDHHVVQQTNFQLPWQYTLKETDGPTLWEDALFVETSSKTNVALMRERGRTQASVVRTHEGQIGVDGRTFNEAIYKRIVANLKKEYAGGVKIAVGTDGGGPFAPHLDMRLMVRDLGLTPAQAITVATKNSAEALNLNNLGTVSAGKDASFIVLNANPLVEIKNTAQIADVYLKGHKVDREMIKKTYLSKITSPPADLTTRRIE
jgi:imidazolonepropionase-like amidohydrolase